jgi:hypothetical protein
MSFLLNASSQRRSVVSATFSTLAPTLRDVAPSRSFEGVASAVSHGLAFERKSRELVRRVHYRYLRATRLVETLI